MASSSENVSMALFCDFENVALGVRDANLEKFDIKPILERLLLKGSIVVKKAYCDWDRYKAFKATMHEANFELIEIPHVRQSGKNSADIRLVVDALDLCYTKSHVNTFVIISGDSDFSPLVSKLRENAKQVIGVGVKQSTSDLLVANCDEFIFYDDLVRETRRTAARNEPKETQPAAPRRPPEEEKRRKDESDARRTRAVDMAAETFEALLAERGDTGKIWASVLKDAIKRRKPDFSETRYGFRAFGNLLEEAQARGLLEIGRDEKSGTYVYRSGGSTSAEAPAPAANLPVANQPAANLSAGNLPEENPEFDDEPAENLPEVVLDRDALPRRAARRGGHLTRQPAGPAQALEAAPAAGSRQDDEQSGNRLSAEPVAPLESNDARRSSRRGRGRKKSPVADLISEQSALEAAYAEHVAHSEFAPPEGLAEPLSPSYEAAADEAQTEPPHEAPADETLSPTVDPVAETAFEPAFETFPESAASLPETAEAGLPPAPQADVEAPSKGPRRRNRGGRKSSEAKAETGLPEAASEAAPQLALELASEAAPEAVSEEAPRRKGRGGRKSAAAKAEAASPEASAEAAPQADSAAEQPPKKPAARRRPRQTEE